MKALLVDTGPLVAILNVRDPAHDLCVKLLNSERRRLLTTWPVVTEAMFLVRTSLRAQRALLAMIESARLELAEMLTEVSRIASLMDKYRDVPMDFADATLVAVAEQKAIDTIFSLDDDFHIYRLEGRRAFQVVP
jgi:uncharacterized protein